MARPTNAEREARKQANEYRKAYEERRDEANSLRGANENLVRQMTEMREAYNDRINASFNVNARLTTAREIVTDQAQQITRLRRELAKYREPAFTLYHPLGTLAATFVTNADKSEGQSIQLFTS